MTVKLTDSQRAEIQALIHKPKYGSSDRDRDKARTVLKRLGLIRFDRKAWTWEVLPAGRALLSPEAPASSKEEGDG